LPMPSVAPTTMTRFITALATLGRRTYRRISPAARFSGSSAGL
jgi:hypothetical protein